MRGVVFLGDRQAEVRDASRPISPPNHAKGKRLTRLHANRPEANLSLLRQNVLDHVVVPNGDTATG